MAQAKILAFSGSVRDGSFNAQALIVAADGAKLAGADVTVINLRDLNLPIYDGDLEAAKGLPEGAKTLKKLMNEHHGFLIATPEYNSKPPALLLNALDWASRTDPTATGEAPMVCYKNKTVAIVSASSGGFAGTKALVGLRNILLYMGAFVLPTSYSIPRCRPDMFISPAVYKEERISNGLKNVGSKLVEFTTKMIN